VLALQAARARCGLFSYAGLDVIAWSLSVCLSVCVLISQKRRAKTTEPIEMPFGERRLVCMSSINRELDGVCMYGRYLANINDLYLASMLAFAVITRL